MLSATNFPWTLRVLVNAEYRNITVQYLATDCWDFNRKFQREAEN